MTRTTRNVRRGTTADLLERVTEAQEGQHTVRVRVQAGEAVDLTAQTTLGELGALRMSVSGTVGGQQAEMRVDDDTLDVASPQTAGMWVKRSLDRTRSRTTTSTTMS